MIRKKSFTSIALAAVSLLSPLSVFATSTLQFSNVGRLTGFSANGDIDGTNGMRWGILIDTAGNGFGDLTTPTDKYNAFNNAVSGFVTIGGTVGPEDDDYFFTPTGLPLTSNQTVIGIDPGGDGGVVSAAGVWNGTDPGRPAGIDTNDAFAIIWFDGASVDGNYYGVFTAGHFLIPASGSLVSFSTPFLSATPEPIKQANIQFGLVPEPSRLMLLGFGLFGLITRRRRN
jgi:PEP-CTERM motif